MSLVTRLGKGSRLTVEEMDGNFLYLEELAQSSSGPAGATGPQGEVGPAGATGPQGEVGPAGATGPQGEVGPAGATGPQGEVGPQGETGAQGPMGAQGVEGPVGPAGLTWSGAWVATQSYSQNYAVGYASASWWCISDIVGATSNNGPDVDTIHWTLLAAQGTQGPMGAQGIQGPTGPQGLQGATGPQGPSGSVTYTDGSLNTTSYSLAGNINQIDGKITDNFTRAYVTSDVNNYLGLSDTNVTTGTSYVVQNKSTTRNIIVRPLNYTRFLQPSGSELDVNFTIKPNTYVRFTLTNTTGGSDRVFMVEVINPLGVAYTEQTRNTSSLATAQNPANLSSKITKSFTRAYVTSAENNYLALSDSGKVIGDSFVVRNQNTTLPITVVLLDNARFLGVNGLTTTANFQIEPSTYARFTLIDTATGSEKIFMAEVIGPLGVAPQGATGPAGATGSQGATGPAGATGSAPVKTRGQLYGDPDSYFNYTTLTYDINIINDGAENSFFRLPDTTTVGKEVIVDVMGEYCRVYATASGAFEVGVTSTTSQIICNYNDLIKFTSIGANYWQVEYLSRAYPKLNGVSLVGSNPVRTFALYNGTASLTRAQLNSTYIDYFYPVLGFSVYGPNIQPSGLVYVKTGTSSWVSLPITTVS